MTEADEDLERLLLRTVEELETTNKELLSTMEELKTMNEELTRANDELHVMNTICATALASSTRSTPFSTRSSPASPGA